MAVVSAAMERRWDDVEVRKERRSSDMDREVMGGLHDVVCGRVKAWVPVKMANRAVERKDFIMSGLIVGVIVVVVFLLLAPPSQLQTKGQARRILCYFITGMFYAGTSRILLYCTVNTSTLYHVCYSTRIMIQIAMAVVRLRHLRSLVRTSCSQESRPRRTEGNIKVDQDNPP